MEKADAFEEAAGESPLADLTAIKALAQRAVELEGSIKNLEEALKVQKSDLHSLRTKALPDAFSEVGMNQFSLDDGTSIKIDDFVAGSLPKDEERRAEAIEALEQIGGGDLMKDDLSVSFNKSQHNEALSLKAQLEKSGFPVKLGTNVHASTLQAFVREKLKSGEEVDYEKIGCYVGRIAKIKIPKGK